MIFLELFENDGRNDQFNLVSEGMLDNPGQEDSPVAQAIIRRILLRRTDLLAKHGPEKVGQAVDEVADSVGDWDEIGSSDVSGWIRQVEQILDIMDKQGVAEAIPDVDHMHGGRGINLPVADTRDLLQKPFEYYGNYKEWYRDVNRVNSELLDDNAEYTTTAGGTTISINGKDFAAWSNRNGNGSIDIGIAKKHSGQGVAEGVNADSQIKRIKDRILQLKDWNTTGSHDKKIKELQTRLKELQSQKQGVSEGAVKELSDDLKTMSDQEFQSRYNMTKDQARANLKRKDENIRGFRGVGGARRRENDENDKIDAMLRQQAQQRKDYEQTGKFWIKQKDTQQHISDEFIGKAAANAAALDMLKQRPELKGNIVITAYGPGESQGMAEAKKKRKKKSSRSMGGYFFPGYSFYGGGGEYGDGGGGGESVAEVSDELRNRYVTRASDDYSNANFAARASKDHPGLEQYSDEQEKRAKKRATGLNRALSDKRLGRTNETEGDMPSQRNTDFRHRVAISYTDPNSSAVSQRKELQQKIILVPATNKDGTTLYQGEAEELARKWAKRNGLRVKEINYVEFVKIKPKQPAVDEGYRVVPGIDRERYTERPGLEGPFHTKSGKVVYYDKQEGKYYDPDSDFYISHDDYQAMNEAAESMPAVDKFGVPAGSKYYTPAKQTVTELSNNKLAQYKTAAAADASRADKAGDFKRGDKRFSGINKATMKQFSNDAKK